MIQSEIDSWIYWMWDVVTVFDCTNKSKSICCPI